MSDPCHRLDLPSSIGKDLNAADEGIKISKLSIEPKDEKQAGEKSVEKKASEHVQELLRLWKHYTTILPTEDTTVRNIAAELCALLLKTKSLDALGVFLDALPNIAEYNTSESIVRAKIHVALTKKDTKLVYQLLQENEFHDGEDLIKIWDDAHYIDEEHRTKKKLKALSKFRVRKRYPPPKTICPSGVRRTNILPREATSYLKTWLMNHLNDPYPSAKEKQHLAQISGLTQAQVKTWFANARRRSKNSDDFRLKCELYEQTVVSPPSERVKSPPTQHHNSTCTESAFTHLQHQYYNAENHLDQLNHERNHVIPSPTYHEYVQPKAYFTYPGYGGQPEHGGHVYDPNLYGSCSTLRVHRPLEQPRCQYDVATRVLIDLSTRGNYHHTYLPPSY